MIKKYTFGNPIATEAVVQYFPNTTTLPSQLKISSDKMTLTVKMHEDDIIYGLGENVRGINKRGWKYISNCADEPIHTEGKNSLYGAHNFLILDGEFKLGIFIDYPSVVTYDVGFTHIDTLEIIIGGPDYDLYLFENSDVREIIKEFRTMIGQSYLAPKWAFGYQQSRWGYENESDIREVVSKHKEHNLPLDAVYMDIDYMERFKDFTIDEQAFPNFSDFVKEMKSENIHLVPIIDAGVKIEEGYDVYEEGVANNYFCKDNEGENFVVGVWPGRVLLPDFLNSAARDWFGKKYAFLLDQGIDGFWNDMNEPALFYSEKNLKKVFEKIHEYADRELGIWEFFSFKDLVSSIDNNPDDYKSFYHNMDGTKIRHDLVHNLYGYNMTRAASDAFKELAPDKNILMFSRASYIGMHRYGGIWTGDNSAWWSHIELAMKMLPSLNMCGFLYSGADTGGFGEHTTEDLVMRFLELSLFTPLLRNHSAFASRDQEVYQFHGISHFRNLLHVRYGLIPYLYSEYIKAIKNNDLLFIPLGIACPDDPECRHIEDQLFVGESIMIAPVYKQNAVSRYVYLPEDMLMIRFRSLEDKDVIPMTKGHHHVSVKLHEVLVFVREGHILPLGKEASNITEISISDFNLLSLNNDKSLEYILFSKPNEQIILNHKSF